MPKPNRALLIMLAIAAGLFALVALGTLPR